MSRGLIGASASYETEDTTDKLFQSLRRFIRARYSELAGEKDFEVLVFWAKKAGVIRDWDTTDRANGG